MIAKVKPISETTDHKVSSYLSKTLGWQIEFGLVSDRCLLRHGVQANYGSVVSLSDLLRTEYLVQ